VNCALSRTVIDSILQGHRRGEVSTIASNFSIPPDVVALLARDSDAEVRRRVASRRDAPPDLLVELARDPDPAVRGVIALQPHLPPGVLDALALDPDIGVRTSASLHPSLTEHQRAEIDYEVRPDVYIGPAVESFIPRDPLWTATCAVSAHPMLRGRAATDPALPLDLMHRLADDSDPTVRLQLAHNHPQAPEHLLLDSFLQGRGHSDRDRHQLTQHPNFPRTGHEPLASHPDPQIRRVAANDPTLPARLIDTLTRDPEPLVRTTAAANPGLPEQRLRELLDQEDLADAAASNPSLPTAWLHELCDRALSGTTAA
jgi:hypothetical protein